MLLEKDILQDKIQKLQKYFVQMFVSCYMKMMQVQVLLPPPRDLGLEGDVVGGATDGGVALA